MKHKENLLKIENCLKTQRMPYVASVLNQILSDLGWTQRELAERCGIPASQVNRYLRGVNGIPSDSARRLAAALPEENRPRFLVAYLRDCVPAEYEHLVNITPSNENLREVEPAIVLPPDMDPDLRRMIERFASLGMRHTQVRDMLESFLRLVDLPRESA